MQKFKSIVFDHDGTLVDTTCAPARLYPGIKRLLLELNEAGVDLYIWTARSRRSLIEILEYLDIMSCFKLLSCATETQMKPSPAGLYDILPNANPEEVLVVGDSLGDMEGARSFKAYPVGALWCHGHVDSKTKYIDHGAKKCFLTVEDCKKFIIENIEVKNV